jgi:hypothetical protein
MNAATEAATGRETTGSRHLVRATLADVGPPRAA